MKYFAFTWLISTSTLFIFNYSIDPFGFRFSSVAKILDLNKQNCVLDRAFIPEAAQLNFRRYLIEKEKPKLVVVGASRVGKIRRSFLKSDSFVNLTLPDFGPSSYLDLVELLEQTPSVRKVILGVEYYAFGNQNAGYKFLDKISRNSILEGIVERAFLTLYRMRGSPLFENPVKKFFSVIMEYISFPATKRSVTLFLDRLSGTQAYYLISLPKDTLAQSSCVLSSTKEINNYGAWDPRDGSEYTRNDLLGLPPATDLREFDINLFDGHDPKSHWSLFNGFSGLSDLKMGVLQKTLEAFRRNGVFVTVFSPPFPDRLREIWNARGYDEISDSFDRRASDLARPLNFNVLPAKKASDFNCKDETDFDDVWHPGDKCMRAVTNWIGQSNNAF